MSDGGASSSAKAAKITYSLNQGTNQYNPFVGLGFWLKPNIPGDTTLNISAASGLTFYFKGDQCDVRVETTNITDFGYYFKRIPAAANWTLVSLKWSDMAQAIWANAKPFDLTKATKIAWQTPDIGKTGDAGSLSIDEIHLPGYTVQVGTRQAQQVVRNSSFSLTQAVPGQLTIRYPSAANAVVSVFDLSGCAIARKTAAAGHATLNLDQSGIYLIRVATEKGALEKRVTVLK